MHGQKEINFSLQSGFDRIGILTEMNGTIKFNNHQAIAGLRYYPLNYFFETNAVGVHLGYAFGLTGQKLNFNYGMGYCFFTEQKTDGRFFLHNIHLYHQLQFRKDKLVRPFVKAGIGIIHVPYKFMQESFNSTYINYELSLGLAFCFVRSGTH